MVAQRGLTLAEILVGVVVLLLVVTLLIAASERATRYDNLVKCRANLKALFDGQETYFAGQAPDRSLRGGQLWVTLAGTDPPHLSKEVLRCPLRTLPEPTETSYWGPSSDVGKMDLEKGYLACDDPLNHSTNSRKGGNVLLRSGEVHTDEGSLWRHAFRKPPEGCTR